MSIINGLVEESPPREIMTQCNGWRNRWNPAIWYATLWPGASDEGGAGANGVRTQVGMVISGNGSVSWEVKWVVCFYTSHSF